MKTARQVALFRGINVGTTKRIAMTDLRLMVESLGYTDVRTLGTSGNVVFTAPEKGAQSHIEAAAETRFGSPCRVMVLSASELEDVVMDNPLKEYARNSSRLIVAVLNKRADRRKIEFLEKQDWAPERLALSDRVAYLWCPDGLSESRVAKIFMKAVGEAATTRNWATVLKLYALTRGEAVAETEEE